MAEKVPALSELLANLQSSLESSATVLPDAESLVPPKDGLSLLDVKNDLILSYLQHLACLLLLKLRGLKHSSLIAQQQSAGKERDDLADDKNGVTTSTAALQEPVVKRLVELRLYLEKGVRPLENRLQYQLDKVIRAADDAERAESQRQKQQKAANSARRKTPAASRKPTRHADDSDVSRSDFGSASSDDDDDDDEAASGDNQPVSDLAYRPNPAAFGRPRATTTAQKTSAQDREVRGGAYRPPRITPMAPPEPRSEKRDRQRREPQKSATLDEFIADELSAAPVAESSIGSTIVKGGQGMRTARDRQKEQERTEFEEANFVRLPQQSKKERAQQQRRERTGFGGEDWRDLDRGLNRLSSLTKRGSSANLLERSRKRKIGAGEPGTEMGETWERRKRAHRKKG